MSVLSGLDTNLEDTIWMCQFHCQVLNQSGRQCECESLAQSLIISMSCHTEQGTSPVAPFGTSHQLRQTKLIILAILSLTLSESLTPTVLGKCGLPSP